MDGGRIGLRITLALLETLLEAVRMGKRLGGATRKKVRANYHAARNPAYSQVLQDQFQANRAASLAAIVGGAGISRKQQKALDRTDIGKGTETHSCDTCIDISDLQAVSRPKTSWHRRPNAPYS